MNSNRRQMMLAAGAALFGPGLLGATTARAKLADPKKILFFTKSSGFIHPVIARIGNQPAFAEKILGRIGAEHGFDVVSSKDGSLFEPDQIGQWDAFVFMTTGDLTQPGTDRHTPISAAGLEAFFAAIQAGKGFVGLHCATTTSAPPAAACCRLRRRSPSSSWATSLRSSAPSPPRRL